MENKKVFARILAECKLDGDVYIIKKILSAVVDTKMLADNECVLPQTLIATPQPGFTIIEKIHGEGEE